MLGFTAFTPTYRALAQREVSGLVTEFLRLVNEKTG